MRVGASQADITPEPGIELAGFLARTQPSTSVLDRLFIKALYVEQRREKLLWLHADLLGFDRTFLLAAISKLNVPAENLILSATHTHSAPASMQLTECGKRDERYMQRVLERAKTIAGEAIRRAEDVEMVTAVTQLQLAVDRRKKPTAHTDPRVAAIGWKRRNGRFVAGLLNYAMHPVAFGSVNRAISADWCGYAADFASQQLPGNPVVLMTNGAAGNVNPPGENVSQAQVREWGHAVARAGLSALHAARAGEQILRVRKTETALAKEIWNEQEIDEIAEKHLRSTNLPAGWKDRYKTAIETWRTKRKLELSQMIQNAEPTDIVAIRLGNLIFVTAGGEFFSRYADFIRAESGIDVHIIGYANGNFGYVAPSAAYDEGGYEVDSAHFFYDTFRAKRGAFEQLARDAAQLVRQL